MCREVSTPEGLRVCADTGEVVGVEMEPAERVFDGVLPRYAPLSPSSHNLLEPVALEWRRDGRPRGLGPGGAVALEARKARRGLRGRFAGSEAVAVRAFKLLRRLAGAVGAPRAVVEEASAVLRRLLAGGGGGPGGGHGGPGALLLALGGGRGGGGGVEVRGRRRQAPGAPATDA